MKVLVVTEVPDPDGPEAVGNLAVPLGELFVANQADPTGVPIRLEKYGAAGLGFALNVRKRVFVRGEILLVDEDGREVSGFGRKPAKWGVRVEQFALKDIERAIGRARELKEE